MHECSSYVIVKANRTRMNKILKRLFQLVDSTGTGFLTRQRVLQLLEEFSRSRAGPEMREFLRSVASWPVLEPFLKFNVNTEKIDG